VNFTGLPETCIPRLALVRRLVALLSGLEYFFLGLPFLPYFLGLLVVVVVMSNKLVTLCFQRVEKIIESRSWKTGWNILAWSAAL